MVNFATNTCIFALLFFMGVNKMPPERDCVFV